MKKMSAVVDESSNEPKSKRQMGHCKQDREKWKSRNSGGVMYQRINITKDVYQKEGKKKNQSKRIIG